MSDRDREVTIETAIYERADTDSAWAIAYALLRVAAALDELGASTALGTLFDPLIVRVEKEEET